MEQLESWKHRTTWASMGGREQQGGLGRRTGDGHSLYGSESKANVYARVWAVPASCASSACGAALGKGQQHNVMGPTKANTDF